MEETRKDKRARRWLVPILILGFFIRLAGLEWGQGYSHFSATDSFEAYSFAVDYGAGDPRAQYIGQPNYNEHSKLPGPLWSVFCLAARRLWGSADGITVAIILLNTAAIGLTYLLAEWTMGSPASLWAALLAATLPFPVYYSTFVYNPNVMPFLGALLFLALWQAVRQNQSRHIFWVGALPFVMFQFHLSIFSVLPAVVIIVVLAGARLNVRWLLAGLFAGCLLYVPYIRGEMAHGWQNTLALGSGRAGHWWGGLKALLAPWNLLVNYVPQWMDRNEDYRELGRACFGALGVLLAVNLLSAIIAVLLLARIFLDAGKAARGLLRSPREAFQRAPGVLFLAILATVPLFCLFVSRQPFHSRYAIVLFAPLLALAGSATAQWIAHPRLGRLLFAGIIAMTCSNIWFMPMMYRYQGGSLEHSEAFYASFHNLETVYQRLKNHAGPGRRIEVNDNAFVKSLPLKDTSHHEATLIRRYVAAREKESDTPGTPAAPALYILCHAEQGAEGGGSAYGGHGIALMAADAPVSIPH